MTGESTGQLPKWRDPRSWLLGVLVLGVAVNLVTFPTVESTTSVFRSRAWTHYPTADIVEYANTNPTSRVRFSLYWALALLAPDSRVAVASEGSDYYDYFRFFLYGAGTARDVQLTELAGGQLTAGDDGAGVVVARGPGGSTNAPWRIVLPQADAALGMPEDPEAFLTTALRAGRKDFASGPARDFVLVEVPNYSTEWGYELILIDLEVLGLSWEEVA